MSVEEEGQERVNASPASGRRMFLHPDLLDRIGIVQSSQSLPLPHVARLIVSTILASKDDAGICVLLPSIEGVAQFSAVLAALECLRRDFPTARAEFIDQHLTPGTRVRALPDGNTYIVGERHAERGLDGVFMYYTEKKTLNTNGKRLVPLKSLLRYEPTTRKLPISRPSTTLSRLQPSEIDALAGTTACGNTSMYKTRSILIGARAGFERFLDGLHLQGSLGEEAAHKAALGGSFSWGTFDGDGYPIVLRPDGAAGQPLVAVARDLLDLEKPCLGSQVDDYQFVVTDRLDLVLKSLDLANRIAGRHRLVVIAEASARFDIGPLKRQGWRVWEPSVDELLPPNTLVVPEKTGIRGFDLTQRSAFYERTAVVEFASVPESNLARAQQHFCKLGEFLGGEAADFDNRMQANLETINDVFFQSANFLKVPENGQFLEHSGAIERLKSERTYLERYLGAQAGVALASFVDDIEMFHRDQTAGAPTPKGRAILDALSAEADQILVAGSRRAREEANDFLVGQGMPAMCRLPGECDELEQSPRRAIAISMLRRDRFNGLVDPWPSQRLIFVGYAFETELYKKRLHIRRDQKDRLSRDQADYYARGRPASDQVTIDPDLAAFDALSGDGAWRWKRRIMIPQQTSSDEPFEPGTIIRFVGQSWMPMTEDHKVATLVGAADSLGKSQIQEIDASELHVGARIIVREGSSKNVIRAIAEQVVGKNIYEMLRLHSSLWRDALQAQPGGMKTVLERLKQVGIRRHAVTIRSWLKNPAVIGPRSDEDVLAIAEAFPVPGKGPADWKRCCDAISELRGLHLSAGSRLTDLLVSSCGKMLFEPAENETAIDLELGTVWILEVAEIDATATPCPTSMLNRLHWLDTRHHNRRLSERLTVRSS